MTTETPVRAPAKRENLLLNLVCNVALPTAILTWFSSEKWLGPKWGLLVALAFPVAYGIHDFIRRRRCNFISVIGFASVLISGGFGLLKLDGFWFAVKDAAIPGIIGCAVLASLRAKLPLVQELLYNPQIMDTVRIEAALAEHQASGVFTQLLRRASYLLAFSFFISAGLNYALARYLLKSPPGTEAFNHELGKMHLWNLPVIVLPSMAMMMFALWQFIKGLQTATGLTFEQMMQESGSGKNPPPADSPAKP
ncbi:MAG: MFS transporter [Opitutaceae bacterium]|nr:MFS transporter [Opitutaceae bacterium]MBP9913163.1 MFS transporter [Opitutaceae bacterium]